MATPEQPKAPAPTQPTPEAEAESIDGLRAWIAQTDRKLGVRSYAGGAAIVLALAAGIVAIVLTLGLKEDSATTGDLQRLRGEVAGVEESATQAAQDDVSALNDRVEELEGQLGGLRSGQSSSESEISVLQDDIADLRDDISALESSGSGPNN